MRLPSPFVEELAADADWLDEEPVAVLHRQLPRRKSWPTPAPYPPPHGDSFFHALIEVTSPTEKTCLGCGETFVGGLCDRCGLLGPGEDGQKVRRAELPPAVLTTSYLRPDEYRLVGK